MQHGPHFLRGQIDVPSPLIGNEEAMAVAVALDGAFEFLKQARGRI